MSQLAIGLMSGTSCDGIDVVLVDFASAQPKLLATQNHSFDLSLKQRLETLITTKQASLQELGEIDTLLGDAYAKAAKQLLANVNIASEKIQVIGCHGQTVFHHPHGNAPFSMQLGNAHLVAQQTGITTVADFRQADIAAGGQGAPLAPLFHQAFFAHHKKKIGVINLGGIANISLLIPGQAVIGFDTGPANTLLDQWCHQHTGQAYDHDGAWANTGQVIPQLLDAMLSDPYFQKSAPKSTGREYFNLQWVEKYLNQCGVDLGPHLRVADTMSTPAKSKTRIDDVNTDNSVITTKPGNPKTHIKAQDVQHTLSLVTAHSIAHALSNYKLDNVYLCGGGCQNRLLVSQLSKILSAKVTTTKAVGIAPQWVEAAGFAWLAVQRLKNTYFDCQNITGSHSSVQLGVVYQ